MARETLNQSHEVKEVIAAMDGDSGTDAHIRRVKLRVAKQPQPCPQYSPDDKQCLLMWLKVNGLTVLALWDTRSTSTAMSPNCTDLSKAIVFNLTEPVTLQLGTIGS